MNPPAGPGQDRRTPPPAAPPGPAEPPGPPVPPALSAPRDPPEPPEPPEPTWPRGPRLRARWALAWPWAVSLALLVAAALLAAVLVPRWQAQALAARAEAGRLQRLHAGLVAAQAAADARRRADALPDQPPDAAQRAQRLARLLHSADAVPGLLTRGLSQQALDADAHGVAALGWVLQVEGRYGALRAWLPQLLRTDPALRLDRLSLQRSDPDGSDGSDGTPPRLHAELHGRLLEQRPATDPPPTASPPPPPAPPR